MKTKYFLIALIISVLLAIYFQYKTTMLRLAEEDNSTFYTLRNLFLVIYIFAFFGTIFSFIYNRKKKKNK